MSRQPTVLLPLWAPVLSLMALALLSGAISAQTRPGYWGTFIGGNADESANDVAVASNGDLIVVGKTASSNLKTGSGAFQKVYKGVGDAFVARISGDGKRLLALTYLGGKGPDLATFVHIAKDGSIWVGGTTSSTDFVTTKDAFAPAPKIAVMDAFLVQLDANLTKLLYSTTYGSRDHDRGDAFFIDEKNSLLYISGISLVNSTSTIPTTANAIRRLPAAYDAYLAILDRSTAGKTLLKYGTYLGGTAQERTLDAMSVDSQGVATLSGTTHSTNFPVTSGSYQSKRTGIRSGFVVRVDPSKTGAKGLVYGSYFGGTGSEEHLEHVADSKGILHLLLISTSGDLPKSSNAVLGKGLSNDAFYAQLDPTKSGSASILYGSWVVNGNGSEGTTWGHPTIDLHPLGVAFFVTSISAWWTLPTTSQSFQRGLRSGVRSYVVVLDTTTKASPFISYASEYGGMVQGATHAGGMKVDASGDLLLVGLSTADHPVSSSAAQPKAASRQDAYVARLTPKPWGGRFKSLGASCKGSAGIPKLTGLSAGIGSYLGKAGALSVETSLMAKNRIAALLLGSDKTWLSIPLPLKIGTTGCSLQASPILVFPFATGQGKKTITLLTPLDAKLVGSKIGLQTLIIDPAANSTQLVLTNGLLAEIGW